MKYSITVKLSEAEKYYEVEAEDREEAIQLHEDGASDYVGEEYNIEETETMESSE